MIWSNVVHSQGPRRGDPIDGEIGIAQFGAGLDELADLVHI